MMHPSTTIGRISDTIGCGVVTTRFIPKGTMVWAIDTLDVRIPENDPRLLNPDLGNQIELYSYIEADGTRIICWDHGKYVNHACEPSTLSTGYGFVIALRDLQPGDEITDDYGLFNCTEPMPLFCNEANCRGLLDPNEFDSLVPSWDARIRTALRDFEAVDQPLLSLVPNRTLSKLEDYLKTGDGYISVRSLRRSNARLMVG